MSEEEVLLAAKGDWDRDFPSDEEKAARRNAGSKKAEWMKFPKPGTYRIRLIGPYVKFLRYRDPFDATRVISHPSYKDKDPAWLAGFYPRETYAIHIMDRAEPGKLKLLEKGNGVFKHFQAFRKANDINPAGKDAPDFQVTVEWPGGNKFQAKYSVVALQKSSPITKEEEELWNRDKSPLNEIYKSTPLEKIVELWNALPEEKKIPPKRDEDGKTEDRTVVAPRREAAIVETIAPPPEAGDDLFGKDDESF